MVHASCFRNPPNKVYKKGWLVLIEDVFFGTIPVTSMICISLDVAVRDIVADGRVMEDDAWSVRNDLW